MRSGLRTILVVFVVACHAIVLSAGPALHGLLGLDHDRVGTSSSNHERTGGHRNALNDSSDDCTACHLLSLVQFSPETGICLSISLIDRIPFDSRPILQPIDVRGCYASRAPPLCSENSRIA